MLEVDLPEPLMLALRWLLLLGPICLVLWFAFVRETSVRAKIGGLFAFLYGLPMIFITHSIALHFGWWRYGWDALMLNGIPADILIGGAILFGPGLFFAFPKVGPLIICLPIVLCLHAIIFSSLRPLVFAGPFWFGGVVFVFITAHIPAIYLAKWTAEERRLGERCTLLAIMTGGIIFAVIPSLIMQAMGGYWQLFDRPAWTLIVTGAALTVTSTIGLAGNQMLCLQGAGTPIPLDPTKRLVRSGIFAYVSNPMQLSAALGWIILGLYLHNIWIIAAAGMAWVFVQGMVRWHHRHDLLKRFPEGWPEYKENVPEWLPRWRPWVPVNAHLKLGTNDRFLKRILKNAVGLDLEYSDVPLAYDAVIEPRKFTGWEARLFALTHVNFAWAVAAHLTLIVFMFSKALWSTLAFPLKRHS
ncbi:MAG: methyltransferase [Hyphomicrobiales bacterium]